MKTRQRCLPRKRAVRVGKREHKQLRIRRRPRLAEQPRLSSVTHGRGHAVSSVLGLDGSEKKFRTGKYFTLTQLWLPFPKFASPLAVGGVLSGLLSSFPTKILVWGLLHTCRPKSKTLQCAYAPTSKTCRSQLASCSSASFENKTSSLSPKPYCLGVRFSPKDLQNPLALLRFYPQVQLWMKECWFLLL